MASPELIQLAEIAKGVLTIIFEVSIVAFIIKAAFWAGKTREQVEQWANSVKDNHLTHIQAATEKSAERLSELQTAMKLHDQNEGAHHAEQMIMLQNIKSDGCDRRCKR